jgi:hypothetical protein
MNHHKCALFFALAFVAGTSFADEEEDPIGPIVGTPVIPNLPTQGTWARVTSSRTFHVGCADYTYDVGVHIDETDPITGGAITVGCNDDVFDRNDENKTTTTPGQWVNAGGGATRARAQANLLGAENVLNLKAEARSQNTRDVERQMGLVVDPWTLDPIRWEKGTGSGNGIDVARLIDAQDSFGSSSFARLADRFVADGTGRLVMQFRADGLFERGGGLPEIMDTGGRVSFAAVLLDPTGLQEFDFGGDFGTVRMWREGSIASAGFALGRDSRDSLFGRSQFPDGEDLLGSTDLKDFAPTSSDVPSDQLPNSPTPVEKELTVALDVVEGKEYWLIAGLFTSATGWNPCDGTPGDGQGPNVAGLDPNNPSACGAGGTDVDFTSTVELSAVIFEGGLRGLQTASGVDYRLAVTAPIPLPPALWLLGAGLPVLAGRVRRMRGTGQG